MADRSTPPEILVITSYFSSEGGEEETITETLIREIARREPVHFTWAATKSVAPLPEIVNQSFLQLPACRLMETLFGKRIPLWTKKATDQLQAAMETASMVWIHGKMECGLTKAANMAKKLGKPVVYTYQGGPPSSKPGFFEKKIAFPTLRNATHAVFTSDKVGEDYYARARFIRPVSIVPNGVDLRTFHAPLLETRRYLRQQFALKADQPILLYVGSFKKGKGIETIREIATRLPNWRFWVAGQGKTDPEKWLLPNLHVFRDRAGASLAELYHTADLLLVPGEESGFPRVIQEAMACGLPVLTSPEIAAGSRAATPWLHLAHTWPDNASRTATVWTQKLLDFPFPLPLQAPLYDLADFAQLTWEWAPIANVYADLFSTGVPPEA